MKQLFFLSLLILSLFIILTFEGCGLARSSHLYRSYEFEHELECYIGETMILEESGTINTVYNTVYPGGIRWELVYAGKSNNNIRIYYREFVASNEGWMAKDAFTQELNYDLNEGSIIRYKQLKMEIISANNEKIIYKVLSGKPKSTINEKVGTGTLTETDSVKNEKPDSNQVIHYIKFPLETNKNIQSKPDESKPKK